MEKRTGYKRIDDSSENDEPFPFVGCTISPHTYTPQSHEKLLRSYSKIKVRESGLTNYKRENKKLKEELNRVNEEVRQNREEIKLLKGQLTNATPDIMSNSDTGTEPGHNVLNTIDTISSHFREMMRRNQSTLADKDNQIKSLQEKLAQYEHHHQRNPPEKQIWSHEFRAYPTEKAERPGRTTTTNQVSWRDLDLEKTQSENSLLEDDGVTYSTSKDRAVVVHPTVETERPGHTNAAIHRGDLDLAKTQLEHSLEDDGVPCSTSKDRAVVVHPTVEAERLRRTNAAIQVFRRDLDLVKTQLEKSPLNDGRFPCSSSRDRAVVDELRRRQNFGVVADLEAMGNKFFRRLEFEERLDKLHWELESRRYLEHKCSSGGECVPTCTYQQEFQMLEKTRNNLLKALGELKAGSIHHAPRPQQQQPPPPQTKISMNTIQTLYMYSPSVNFAQPFVSLRGTTSELPDK